MKTQGYLCLYCKLKLLFEKATLWIPHLQAGLSERPTELFQDLRLYRETDTNNLFIFLFSFFLFSPFFFFQFKQSQNKWTKQNPKNQTSLHTDIFSSACRWNKLLLLLVKNCFCSHEPIPLITLYAYQKYSSVVAVTDFGGVLVHQENRSGLGKDLKNRRLGKKNEFLYYSVRQKCLREK